jgi:DNA-binding response OmpR family regulator
MKQLKAKAANFVVLLVEDDEPVRQQMATLLRLLFSQVDEAADGEAGLQRYRDRIDEINTPYDIVISDIRMPRMDGIELTRKLLEEEPGQKVVITSAYSEKEYLIELINIGIAGFFQKPIDETEMFAVLDSTCSQLLGEGSIDLGEGYVYDASVKTLHHDGRPIQLSQQERRLMCLMSKNSSTYFSSVDIFHHVWYEDVDREFSDDAVRSLIKRLRKKLPPNAISHIRNLGYTLKTFH